MRAMPLGLTILGLTLSAAAQDRPDFSGSWVASKDAPANVAAAPSPIMGPRFWLQQTADQLTVIRPVRARDDTIHTTFTLDGREVRTRVPGGVCQGDSATLETAAWDGTAIAFTTVANVPPGGGDPAAVNIKRVLRLQSADTLLVEATMPGERGKARQIATLYRRSPDPVPPRLETAPPPPAATLSRVAWMSGTWISTSQATTVEERWTPATGGSMLATSRTLLGPAMLAFEFLCIAERNGSLIYTAMPNARTPATAFMLTAVTEDSVTFENPAHDFPKKIRYARLPDGSLEATVSGDGQRPPERVVYKRQD